MAFHNREYEVYLILGNPRLRPLWHWSNWRIAAALFEPLSAVPRGPAAVRVNQTVHGEPGKLARFGRLGWNEASHRKWTFGSAVRKRGSWPTTKSSKRGTFLGMEAWSPSWNQCEASNRAPDFYFQIFNAKTFRPQPLKFNPIILCAAGVSLDQDYLHRFAQAAKRLAELVDSRLFARKRRAWGLDSELGGGIFERSLMDLPMEGGLFRGDPHSRPTDFRILAEKWEHVR